jgi:hypothetical protein
MPNCAPNFGMTVHALSHYGLLAFILPLPLLEALPLPLPLPLLGAKRLLDFQVGSEEMSSSDKVSYVKISYPPFWRPLGV